MLEVFHFSTKKKLNAFTVKPPLMDTTLQRPILKSSGRKKYSKTSLEWIVSGSTLLSIVKGVRSDGCLNALLC